MPVKGQFKPCPDGETLRVLYVEQGISQGTIGRHFGVNQQLVGEWLRRQGIPCRRAGGTSRLRLPMPSRETLVDLYETQRLNSKQIAAAYHVCHHTVIRWLRRLGIAIRPIGRGLANQGEVEPTRDELQRWVHAEHRTYEDIGRQFGVGKSSVQFWMDKYGIERPNAWVTRKKGSAPEMPTPEALAELYESGLSMDEIGARFLVSAQTIQRAFQQAGIKSRPAGILGVNGVSLLCNDGHYVRSSYERRVDDWLSSRGIPHVYEPPLPFHGYRGDFLANGWYIEVWGMGSFRAYPERKALKQRLYKEYGLPLVDVDRQHLNPTRRDALTRRLAACLEPAALPLFPEP